MSRSGNKREAPKFPVGCLVRLVSSRSMPPEGFRLESGYSITTEEIPDGSLGVIVHPPFVRYVSSDPDRDIMAWVLVGGQVLEVPHIHIRRL